MSDQKVNDDAISSKTRTISNFNRMSGMWDSRPDAKTNLVQSVDALRADAVQAKNSKTSRLLDFGTGTGSIPLAASAATLESGEYVWSGESVGIDLSDGMIATFQKSIDAVEDKAIKARLKAIHMDVTDNNAVNTLGQFDVIFSQKTFHHVELDEIPTALNALYSLLKPDGVLVLMDLGLTNHSNEYHPKGAHVTAHGFALEDFENRVDEAGFTRTASKMVDFSKAVPDGWPDTGQVKQFPQFLIYATKTKA